MQDAILDNARNDMHGTINTMWDKEQCHTSPSNTHELERKGYGPQKHTRMNCTYIYPTARPVTQDAAGGEPIFRTLRNMVRGRMITRCIPVLCCCRLKQGRTVSELMPIVYARVWVCGQVYECVCVEISLDEISIG